MWGVGAKVGKGLKRTKYFTLECQDLPAAKELSSAGYQNVIIVVG